MLNDPSIIRMLVLSKMLTVRKSAMSILSHMATTDMHDCMTATAFAIEGSDPHERLSFKKKARWATWRTYATACMCVYVRGLTPIVRSSVLGVIILFGHTYLTLAVWAGGANSFLKAQFRAPSRSWRTSSHGLNKSTAACFGRLDLSNTRWMLTVLRPASLSFFRVMVYNCDCTNVDVNTFNVEHVNYKAAWK